MNRTKPQLLLSSRLSFRHFCLLISILQNLSLPLSCSAEPAAQKTKEAVQPNLIPFEVLKRSTAGIDLKNHSLTLKEMDRYWDKKNVYIIDLRSESDFKRGHFKGAIHLGADIDEKKLAKLIPNKDAVLITYCNNSLYPTRMISLTHSCLPQFITLGYKNVYTLEPIWRGASSMPDISKNEHWAIP